jgi:hypothetical protein
VNALEESQKTGRFRKIGVHYLKNVEELWELKFIAQNRTKEHNKKLLAEAKSDLNLHETLRRNMTNERCNDDDKEGDEEGYRSDSSNSSDDDFSLFEDFTAFLRMFRYSDENGITDFNCSLFIGSPIAVDNTWITASNAPFLQLPLTHSLPQIKKSTLSAIDGRYAKLINGIYV